MSIFPLYGQNNSTDKIILKSTETYIGKILKIENNSIRIERKTKEEILVPFDKIDTITGTNYKTRFIGFSTGFANYKYYSPFLASNSSITGIPFQFRFGKLKRKKWSRFSQFTLLPQRNFTAFKYGYGMHFYVFKKYYDPFNLYFGFVPELNVVRYNNAPFVSFTLQSGASWLIKNKIRVFSEVCFQRSIMNMNNSTGVSINAGIRLNREFLKYYKELNDQLK